MFPDGRRDSTRRREHRKRLLESSADGPAKAGHFGGRRSRLSAVSGFSRTVIGARGRFVSARLASGCTGSVRPQPDLDQPLVLVARKGRRARTDRAVRFVAMVVGAAGDREMVLL